MSISNPFRGIDPGEVQEAFAVVNNDTRSALRLLPEEVGWNSHVRKVIVILSASRSGSSLIHRALFDSGNVVACAGEHEPWLFLTNNKYPFTRSDEITTLQNRDDFLRLLRNDLLVPEARVAGREFADLLWNRLAVRSLHTSFPLQEVVRSIRNMPTIDREDHRHAMKEIEYAQGARSLVTSLEHIGSDKHVLPTENLPYITQPLARRATLEELVAKPVLFKSPEDAYRPGFYESLFPSAEISYIHLTRGFAQTVNGLMDGWASKNEADFASSLITDGRDLAITDYSDSGRLGSRLYWCFDLFPDWQRYRDGGWLDGVSLIEVCTQQWLSAHERVLDTVSTSGRITFELLYRDPDQFCRHVEVESGVALGTGSNWSTPTMHTELPRSFRWHKRRELFENTEQYLTPETIARVRLLQKRLGYSMNPDTWH